MDRGAWHATIHRVIRVEHDLLNKPLPPGDSNTRFLYCKEDRRVMAECRAKHKPGVRGRSEF